MPLFRESLKSHPWPRLVGYLNPSAAEYFQLVHLPIAVDAVLALGVGNHAELVRGGGMMVADEDPAAATDQRLFALAAGISGRLIVRRLMQLANIAAIGVPAPPMVYPV